jgi:hypothetical protein
LKQLRRKRRVVTTFQLHKKKKRGVRQDDSLRETKDDESFTELQDL